jgi:hypothetical protein
MSMLSAKYNVRMNTRDLARRLGRRGGLARARGLRPEERRRIAALGGESRRRSLEAARRVAANFRYADAIVELQGGRPAVKRMRSCRGPLPGIYPTRP